MTINRFLVCLTVLALLASSAWMGHNAAAPKTSVAVVDLDQVFKNSREADELNAEAQRQLEMIKREIESLRENIEIQQSKIDLMVDKNSEDYRKSLNELEKSVLNFQVLTEIERRKLQRSQVVNIERLYRSAQRSIEQVAKTNGYDLVLFNEQSMDLPTNVAPEVLMGRMAQRKVLYNANSIDITDQVIQDMNSRL